MRIVLMEEVTALQSAECLLLNHASDWVLETQREARVTLITASYNNIDVISVRPHLPCQL